MELLLLPWNYLQLRTHYFANKGPSSQSYSFSNSHVWMWELDYKESWVPRIDAFPLWCWRTLLRVPAWRSNQSILKEISPEHSLKGLMLRLQLRYFGHLIQRTDSLEKTLMLGKTEGEGEGDDRGWDAWHCWLDGHEFEQAPGVGDGQGGLGCCSPWGRKESETTEQLN